MTGKTVEITLTKPLVGHGGPVTRVVVREPTYAEYLQYGDPFVVALSQESKTPFMVEDNVAFASYMTLLVVEPDALVVQQGGLDLARQVRGAVRSFFRDGAEEGEASEMSPTSSRSEPDKAATPSEDSPSANSSTGTAAPSRGRGAASRPVPEPPPRGGDVRRRARKR
jgi:hypothetical protein